MKHWNKMAAHLVFVAALTVLSLQAKLPAETANGLRVRIACDTPTISAPQQPVFRIWLDNISNQNLTLPAPAAYMAKSHEQVRDFYAKPLHPIVERVAGQNPTYSILSGRDPKTISKELVTIRPGESLELQNVPLQEDFYTAGRAEGDRAGSKLLWLLPESSYRISFYFENEQAAVAGRKVWVGKATSNAITLRVATPLADFKVDGAFTLPKTEYFVGEPIRATFTVTNNGPTTINFSTGGDYRGTGRHERFSFTATDEQGRTLPDPIKPSGMGGGLGGGNQLSPRESYSETLLVNQWCALIEPGRYTLTCKRTLNLQSGSVGFPRPPEIALPALPIETKLTITLHRDANALAKYIESLVARLSQQENNSARDEIKALALARNEAVFPALETLARSRSSLQPDAVKWLSYFGKDKAGPILREVSKVPDSRAYPNARVEALEILAGWKAENLGAAVRDALLSEIPEERRAAVQLCSRETYPECFPILLKMAGDEDKIVRRYLGAALGAYENQQAVPVLQKLLRDTDTDHFIKIWAAQGLGKLGRKDGVSVLIDLLRLDETKSYRGNITHVLEELTGHKLREDYVAWHGWWQKQEKTTVGKKP